MVAIRPLRGVRPRNDIAGEVLSPPYDVVSEAEARAIAAAQPRSFMRVVRSEVDLPEGCDAHAPEAYTKARENLEDFIREGILSIDEDAAFYLYGQVMGDHKQMGLLACCSVDEYDQGLIAKHEHTRPAKVEDRTAHIQTLDAQIGLVFLTFRAEETVKSLLASHSQGAPEWRVTTDDGVEHALWVVRDEGSIAAFQAAFDQIPKLYIADGHHRSESASRVAALREGDGNHRWFLTGIFSDDELYVMAYNRIVADLNGHSPEAFLSAVGEVYTVTTNSAPVPAERGQVSMYLAGSWYGLAPREGMVPSDPVGCLDVAVLQDRILAPVLNIDDPRTNDRVAFVGGIRGPEALAAAVDSGRAAVAFHMYPTGLDQLFAVADAGEVMPPKSTWFEPKLRAGVVFHRLSD